MDIFKLNNTVIRRSIIYRVVLFFISILYWGFNAIITVELKNPYYIVADYSDFPEIAILIILFGSAVYFAQQPSALEEACFIPKHKIAFTKLISLIWCNLLLLLNPLIYIGIMSIIEKTSLLFCILVMLRIVIRWLQIMLLAQVLGFCIGYFMRSMYAYLCAILFAALFSFINQTIFSYIPLPQNISEILTQFLSLNKEFADGLQVEYAGALTTRYHLFKLITILFIAIGVANTMVLILNKYHRRRNMIAYIPIVFCLLACITGYVKTFPQPYDPMKKLSSGFSTDAPYHISSYAGALNLSETIIGDIDFVVSTQAKGSLEPLSLKLDAAFDISQMLINGEPATFDRYEDYIIVTDENMLAPEQFEIHIEYSGRVSYINMIHSPNIFSTAFAAALPPNFAFLPLMDGDTEEHTFDLRVCANNTIASNLDIDQEDKNTYRLSGTAKTVAIFEGFLTSHINNGVEVCHASYLNDDVFRQELESLTEGRPIIDWQTLQDVDISDLQYSKVFLIYNSYYEYNAAVAYDDYIILNTNNARR